MRRKSRGTRALASKLCARALLIVAVAALCAPDALARGRVADRVAQLPPVSYTAIDGHVERLRPWQGRHVSVLVEPGPVRNPRVMDKLVAALDRAWSYYAATTGRLPAVGHSLHGRDEIAEVTSTCGAGCTYVGATGTEMLTQYFESMYRQLAQNGLYNQIPFYELGRSFWFWNAQLQFHAPDQDPVVTGFAVLMRFTSMAAARVAGAPFNGTPFRSFARQVRALAGQYEADPALTFAGTLAQDKSPGAYGGTDFWASLMMQLARRHGGQVFWQRFFHHARRLPAASSTAGAVHNWVRAASYAACTNLSAVFYTRWGFPRANGRVTPRPPAAAVPEPRGSCTSVSIGRARATREGVTVSLKCTGAPKSRCRLTLAMSVKRGGRAVIVGLGRRTLAAGHARAIRVGLNRTGRRLLLARRHLTVTLTVTDAEHGGYSTFVTRRLRLP